MTAAAGAKKKRAEEINPPDPSIHPTMTLAGDSILRQVGPAPGYPWL